MCVYAVFIPNLSHSRPMDPVLVSIIKNYKDAFGNAPPPSDDIGEFTNRIIISKKNDKRYFMRMIVLRLENQFNVLSSS